MSALASPTDILAAALARAEGSPLPGTNNPGNLEIGDIGYGVTEAAGGNPITNFPTMEAGEQALENQAAAILSGSSAYYNPTESLEDIGDTYSPGGTWANNMANILGTTSTTPLNQIPALNPTQQNSAQSSVLVPNVNTGTDPLSLAEQALQLGGSIVGTASGEQSTKSVNQATIVSRVVFGLLGLILIAAGVFSFKTTQLVVKTGGDIARRAVEASGRIAEAGG